MSGATCGVFEYSLVHHSALDYIHRIAGSCAQHTSKEASHKVCVDVIIHYTVFHQ